MGYGRASSLGLDAYAYAWYRTHSQSLAPRWVLHLPLLVPNPSPHRTHP